MDAKKVLEVIQKYRDYFAAEGIGIRDFSETDKPNSQEEILAHCHGMLNKMEGFVREGRMEKTFRWLGFIQGCLWTTKRFSLGQLMEDNRPNKKE